MTSILNASFLEDKSWEHHGDSTHSCHEGKGPCPCLKSPKPTRPVWVHVPRVLLNQGHSLLSRSNFHGGHTYHPMAPVCSHRCVVYPQLPSLLNTAIRADTLLERGREMTHGTWNMEPFVCLPMFSVEEWWGEPCRPLLLQGIPATGE